MVRAPGEVGYTNRGRRQSIPKERDITVSTNEVGVYKTIETYLGNREGAAKRVSSTKCIFRRCSLLTLSLLLREVVLLGSLNIGDGKYKANPS